jgi:hypothetical protein
MVKNPHTDRKHYGSVLDTSDRPLRMHSSRRHSVAAFVLR